MGKVFSIGTQKGGAGKSTVSTLTAGIINEICKTKNISFALIDSDFQQTIYNGREFEYSDLEDETIKRSLYPIFGLEHIAKDTIIQDKLLQSIINKYDIVMIDVPGTLDFENSTKIYRVLEYIFVPTYKDDYSIKSTIEFLYVCESFKKSMNYQLKEYFWFFNQYFQKSFVSYNDAEDVIESIFPNKKLTNNIIRSEELISERSTIDYFKKKQFHKPSTTLYNFVAEIMNIMYNGKK